MGFLDLGKVNDELDQLATAIQGDQQRLASADRQLAKQMLVLMVRSIAKPSFTFPVAQYPTTKLTGEKLFPVVWDTVEALELNGIHVVSITSDGASPNRKFYHMCAESGMVSDVPC